MRSLRLRKCIAVFAMLGLLFSYGKIDVYAANTGGQSDIVVVSMGDSYSSGEGLGDYYGWSKNKTERTKSSDFMGHRSKKAWAGMLEIEGIGKLKDSRGTSAKDRNANWFFVASSGAVIDDFYHDEEINSNVGLCLNYGQKVDYSRWGVDATYKQIPQLDILKQLSKEGRTVDYVTMTVGGNDLQFSKIVESVITSYENDYIKFGEFETLISKQEKKIKQNSNFRKKLRGLYKDIFYAAPNARIIVAGYPHLFEKTGKGLGVSKKEAERVNGDITDFNKAIIEEIENAKEEIKKEKSVIPDIVYVSVEKEFDNHEAYSNDPYINKINYLFNKEDLKTKIGSSVSMHPNKKGADVYRKCVQTMIDDLGKKDSNTTTQPTETAPQIDEMSLYGEILHDYKNRNNSRNDDDYIGSYYMLHDVNGDGVKELFLSYKGLYQTWSYDTYLCDEVYSIVNNKPVKILDESILNRTINTDYWPDGKGNLCEIQVSSKDNRICAMTYADYPSDAGYFNYHYLKLESNGRVSEDISYYQRFNYDNNTTEYTSYSKGNRKNISENEFDTQETSLCNSMILDYILIADTSEDYYRGLLADYRYAFGAYNDKGYEGRIYIEDFQDKYGIKLENGLIIQEGDKYAYKDINGDGIDELIIADFEGITSVFSYKDGKYNYIINGHGRKTITLLDDNSFFDIGDAGGMYGFYHIYHWTLNGEGTKAIMKEGYTYDELAGIDEESYSGDRTFESDICWYYTTDEDYDISNDRSATYQEAVDFRDSLSSRKVNLDFKDLN
ncbi:MAG: hypothetical protein IJ619_00190 [Eubacterium sp.]|nr:hypothetical protein [Eubacterium sp.]